jgi:Pyruvate/2-oxoacid:ferredoxin oxidoreductase delta subunit
MRRWSGATDLRIAGLPRRAVKWLFHAAGQTLPETAEVLDPRKTTPDEIVRGLLAGAEEGGDAATHGQDGGRGLRRPAGPEQPRLSATHGRDAHATDVRGVSHDTPKQEALGGGTDQLIEHDAHATGLAEAMTVVLYEGPGARAMTPRRRAELILAAVAAGYRVVRPAPGCWQTAGVSVGPAIDTSAVASVGEFEAWKTPPLAGAGVVHIDAAGKCACGTIGAVDEARAAMHLPKPGEWAAWFPVIDYDRCAGCKQCANFCLFGVFSTDGGVRVATPAACKTNCPACARMCPQAAIIFPHYPTGPINGQEAGEQPGGGDAAVSLKEALRGDVYQVLRSRQGGAASLAAAKAVLGAGNRGPANLADMADLAGLAKVAEQLEIPPQVLMSLGVSGASAGAGCNCECGADAACDVDHRPADEPSADCQCDCDCDCSGQAEGDNCDCDCDESPTGSERCCCQSDGGQQDTAL